MVSFSGAWRRSCCLSLFSDCSGDTGGISEIVSCPRKPFFYIYIRVQIICIQDTLKSPPPESQTMKRASTASIIITAFFYLSCGCFGYAAFGDKTPGNLLTGFGFYEPYWLVDFANACIILHLVGGFQVYIHQIASLTSLTLAIKYFLRTCCIILWAGLNVSIFSANFVLHKHVCEIFYSVRWPCQSSSGIQPTYICTS